MCHRAPAADCRDADIKRRNESPQRRHVINQRGYLTQLSEELELHLRRGS